MSDSEAAAASPAGSDEPSVLNIAGYLFTPLDRLTERRAALQTRCAELDLKGTILLSPEGINLFLAGTEAALEALLADFAADPLTAALTVKRSRSDEQPFNRMLVKIKREIIAFGVPGIEPQSYTSPRLSPAELKAWLDEGRPLTLLDTRNDFEIELGTFAGALPIGVDNFRDFPEAARKLPAEMKSQPVVTFCTGGIRCEKAAPLLEAEGFEQVYQLDGGILQYFEDCGGDHYEGDCFVFDRRVAVNPSLEETDAKLCFACQAVLSARDQQSADYIIGISCPHCAAAD